MNNVKIRLNYPYENVLKKFNIQSPSFDIFMPRISERLSLWYILVDEYGSAFPRILSNEKFLL